MPRELRSFEPGVVYHLISRFVGGEFFITKQLERSLYLELHRKALKRSDWQPLGYALMSNHIHLAVVAGRKPLSEWLRAVHTRFADILNKAHDRIGPIFVRGPKAFPVVDSRVAHLLAYIHNNPVRANVCATAGETNWTSHRAYVGLVEAPRWLNVGLGLELSRLSAANFDEWVNDPAQRADRSFSEESHERELALMLADEEEQHAPSSDQTDLLAVAIVQATAQRINVPVELLRGRSRGHAEVLGRAVAIHCAATLGLPDRRIALALNLSQQRVSTVRNRQCDGQIREIAAVVRAWIIARPTIDVREPHPVIDVSSLNKL